MTEQTPSAEPQNPKTPLKYIINSKINLMSLEDFEIISRLGKLPKQQIWLLLGEGAYSSVWQVRRNIDGKVYALKKVKMSKLSDKEKENALNEVRILASVRHKSLCAFNEAFVDELG